MTPRRAILLSLAITAVVSAVMLTLRVNVDRVIGIAGFLFAFVAFALQQFQLREAGTHEIGFLAKSRSPFARNILRGLKEELRKHPELRLVEFLPEEGAGDMLAWQLRQLRSASFRDLSALVIIPATDSVDLWKELALLTNRGMFIVAVDVKPSNKIFNEHGARRPAFVGSDFDAGGKLVADFLLGRLPAARRGHAVICLGPDSSWPAVQRGAKLLYHLARNGYGDRVSCVTIDSWNAEAAREALVSHLQQLLKSHSHGEVFVFCGNDKILCAAEAKIAKLAVNAGSHVHLIGYDGATDEDGRFIVTQARAACATVDAVPLDQGHACGAFVLNEYHDLLVNPMSTSIEPTLRTLDSGGHGYR